MNEHLFKINNKTGWDLSYRGSHVVRALTKVLSTDIKEDGIKKKDKKKKWRRGNMRYNSENELEK